VKGKKKSACSVRNDGLTFCRFKGGKPGRSARDDERIQWLRLSVGGRAAAWHNAIFMERAFHVYFMASKSGVLYLGVTGRLAQRVFEHRGKLVPGFTQKYNVTKLVWFEPHASARAAISREKEIKGWRRAKKVALIEAMNPRWDDLSVGI
jgi:putative endonuclease